MVLGLLVALVACGLFAAPAEAYLINNTPLDLDTATLGVSIATSLSQDFEVYDLAANLALKGNVTSDVYYNAATQVAPYVYAITLTGGYGGGGVLDLFQISDVQQAVILDSGYHTGSDAYTTGVDYSPTVEAVEYRFHNYDFTVGKSAKVWLQSDMFDVLIGTGDVFAIGGNGIIDVYVPAPVPEPATLLLLGFGATVLSVAARKRRRK